MEIALSIDDSRDVIERANEITGSENKEHYTLDDILDLLEDMTVEYGRLEEEHETLEENMRDYYTEKSPYSVYGVSENDFHW